MFTYFINDTQYTPLNEGDFTFDIELKNDAGAYHYAKFLTGSVLFDGAAYEYVMAHSDTQKILFKVYETTDSGTFLIFDHALYFTNRDCEINEDLKQIRIELKADSYYQKILDAADINFNFLEVSNVVESTYIDTPEIEYDVQTLLFSAVPYKPFFGEGITVFPAYTNSPFLAFWSFGRQLTTTYCRGGVPATPAGVGWELFINNCDSRKLATWWRKPPVLIGTLLSANFGSTTAAVPTIPSPPPVTVANEDWVLMKMLTIGGITNISFWIDNNVIQGTPISLNNGRLLVDVINYRLFQINPNLALQSNLLFNITNPVTGVSPSDLYQVQMHAIRDIKDPAATEQATVENTNLKEILEGYIQGKLNAFWRVDENTGRVIVEHYQDLDSNKTFDLTAYPEYLLQNKYSYDNSYIPKAEEFPSLDSSVDFTGVDTIFENPVSTGKNAYSTDKFYSEVASIIQNPDVYGNDGIVIITPDSLAPLTNTVPSGQRSELGAITNNYYPNAPQGTANLHSKYWHSYRPFQNGNMNLEDVQFVDNRPVKVLEPITIPLCSFYFFDPYANFIGDNFTEGKLKKASFSPKTKQITLDIQY